MDKNRAGKKSYLPLIKKTGAILIGLYVLYIIVGLWIAPPLLKTRLVNKISDKIGRNVTIEAIKFNPSVLSATAANLKIHETGAEPLAGFDELLIDVQTYHQKRINKNSRRCGRLSIFSY